jgi:hypothetical protein
MDRLKVPVVPDEVALDPPPPQPARKKTDRIHRIPYVFMNDFILFLLF